MSKKNKIAKRRGIRSHLKANHKKIKKDVFRTIIRLVKACDAYEEFLKLPEKDIGLLKRCPFKTVLVKSDDIVKVRTSIITNSRKGLSEYIHTKKIKLDAFTEEFSLFDIITAGLTLWFNSLKKSEDDKWLRLYEKMTSLWEYFTSDSGNFIFDLIASSLQEMIENYSHVDGCFYWLSWKSGYFEGSMGVKFVIHKEKCFSKKIVLDQRGRPIFRVGYTIPQNGLKWISIKGEKLNHLNRWINKNRDYPIYVQSHALQRLRERLFPVRFYERLLYSALIAPEVSKGPGDKIFLVLKHEGCKLGYLLCKFTGMELVIVSFLFITNSGTKEGTKFNEQLKLKAYSKNYFKLDLLETYITTNICNDPYFRAVLKKCGCADLVKYKDFFKEDSDNMFASNLKKELALETMAG